MTILSALAELIEKANQNPEKVQAIFEYLKYFNYVAKNNDISLDDIVRAIKRFQDQFGIKEENGLIGKKTINAMTWPRCGVREHDVEAIGGAVAKWGVPDITFYVRSRDNDLAPDVWDGCLQRAFNNWSAVVPLTFHQVQSENQANIIADVGYTRVDDFDGPSGVLAWFQLVPQNNFKGQILGKFDLSETWLKDSNGRGIILPNVATHEFGHALGLVHSSVSTALMAPFYSPNIEKPQQNDDIPRMQALYGKVANNPPQPPIQPPIPTGPDGTTTIQLTGNITSISIPGYRVTKMG